MHDVVRDVAIKIASNEGRNMLLGSSDNWPEDDVLRRCTAVTFPYGNVPSLPECLVSPSLEFLLLYHNHSSLLIRDNLFDKMQKLTVLDIRSIDLFPNLPPSLVFLKNLHSLSLNLCKLRDISVVGALKNLKTLSLNNTNIEELPMEIKELSELRVLDLNGCSQLKIVPPGIIPCLSQLEELHMAKSFSQWEAEGLVSSERRNARLDELNYLVKLTTLRIHIPDANLLPKDFHFEKLVRFTILIGDEKWDWSCHDEQSLYRFSGIKINFSGSRNIHLEAGVQEMLKRAEILYLKGMKNINELEWKLFQKLKFVHIQDSAETRCIVNTMESFPAGLESLYLCHLPRLQNLCRGMFKAESSFNKLKHVEVNNCNSLRNLFSFSMARGLMHLEEVKVTNCDSLEAIVEDNREDGKNGDIVMDKLEFCQLRSLILKSLPKLTSFCNSVTNYSICSEDGCTIVAPFFSGKVLFPKLEKLILKECDSMEYLFSESIVMGLEQLNFIAIEDCKLLKGIVAHVEGEETNETIKFPQLVNLSLEVLPCVTSFYSGCSIVFPMLTRLLIHRCSQLKTFASADTVREDETVTNKKLIPLFNEKVELPNLKTLLLLGVAEVETIWHNSLHEDSFLKLEKVYIRGCPNLLKIFPSTMLGRIQSLEELHLWDNCSVEEVFENDEMAKPNISQGGETTEDEITFSQLRRLELTEMSNLKRFCSGSCVVFSALTRMEIRDCKQMETFMYPIAVSNSRRKGVEDMDSNDMQPLFNEKVEFPSLKELELEKVDSIKIIWDGRIHEGSFCTLEQVTIRNCANLLKIFPLAVLERIQSLKKLYVKDSCLVQEIFEAPTMVSDLYLENLPQLKCVWKEDLVQILSFRNLSRVEVRRCQTLKYLFPFSVAQQLYHLEKLRISDCGVETIVCRKEEEVKEEVAAFVFPKLDALWLEGLPKLESFYPGRHTTQWPSLDKLLLVGMFPSDLVKSTGYGGDSLLIPILEKIEFLRVRNCPSFASIVQGLVSFKFLTELQVSNCDGLVNLVQFSTAKSLVQLTTLEVTGCETIKEIVASESADGAEDEIVFSKLKTLELTRLPSFANFGPGNCVLKFPLLEAVIVDECINMKTFCGGITTTPKLRTLYLNNEKMVFEGDEEDKDLNTIIKLGKTGIVTELGKKTEVKQDRRAETRIESTVEAGSFEQAIQPKEVHTGDKAMEPNDNESRKEGEFCEEIVEPREEIDTCKDARNEDETLLRPYLVKGSLAPTPDETVHVTCPSSQSHPALGSASNDFEGLQVAQYLVPLLEKARDKHGDFHNSTSIKSKAVRITAIESVGQVLEVLQTQTPRTIDAEKIQFMEEAFHDLSFMNFPIEWLHPFIDNANKWPRRKAKIEEMEEQLQALKREMEMEKALDQPLLDI